MTTRQLESLNDEATDDGLRQIVRTTTVYEDCFTIYVKRDGDEVLLVRDAGHSILDVSMSFKPEQARHIARLLIAAADQISSKSPQLGEGND